ncbi:hypothetical protein V6R21_22585 [Limibacter armeniacum]|uniref:hypothetical protein n=1 Tax=Limibacter armeniacum TaxID=466084 RepID=UPI002FE4FCA8
MTLITQKLLNKVLQYVRNGQWDKGQVLLIEEGCAPDESTYIIEKIKEENSTSFYPKNYLADLLPQHAAEAISFLTFFYEAPLSFTSRLLTQYLKGDTINEHSLTTFLSFFEGRKASDTFDVPHRKSDINNELMGIMASYNEGEAYHMLTEKLGFSNKDADEYMNILRNSMVRRF